MKGKVARARLYITAHGIYVAHLNGRRVGDQELAPGWTSYDKRLRYQAYDVTSLVHEGDNRLDILLGNGWFRGHLGFNGKKSHYGDRLAVLAQLEVTTTDGEMRICASDATWAASDSHIVHDDLYDGQTTDLTQTCSTVAQHTVVEIIAGDLGRLVAAEGPPVRRTAVVPATKIWTSPSGQTIVDFGQNLVGWVRVQTRGRTTGGAVRIRHAEVLENGELGTRPLRGARATDVYIIPDGVEALTLEPSLTFHGFRYAEVSGLADIDAGDVVAVVLGSDLVRTGWFASSSPMLNRFHENVVWSMRGNFIDIPMDCPQRDERLGWTGDVQVFAPTAAFLYDIAGFMSSWLSDLAIEQLPDGTVPHIVPYIPTTEPMLVPAAAWGDAATIVPWLIYKRFGDLAILERQFSSMKAWVDKIETIAGSERIWDGGFQYGDWLDPTAPPDDPYRAKANPAVIATACFAHSAGILAAAATLLGLTKEAEQYSTLTRDVCDAFAKHFIRPGGRMDSDSATEYALLIAWALAPDEESREGAGRRLAELVKESDYRIITGFVGTPLICDALTATGNADVAHRLLFQTANPSWLYAVTMGGTTVWERWDSMLPDGTINPGEMTSFNHYALGAVGDWMHGSVAGLRAADRGYRRLLFKPIPPNQLKFAEARHVTPYGEAAVRWERASGVIAFTMTVPVGASAIVELPGQSGVEFVGHGVHHWEVPDTESPNASAADAQPPDG
ncbi:alpha-L-rhamnosidase [Microbacterium sp. cf046]|uniref:alpha-L-rhamnosidase n=1 Tax=Microbacterium sp. cf046 TaxID=1761803 RepID=UPI0020C8BC84|nr:alpha-L-rhamnosidase [Microbacterium sp. cf046]